jgi:hypothetical protein
MNLLFGECRLFLEKCCFLKENVGCFTWAFWFGVRLRASPSSKHKIRYK